MKNRAVLSLLPIVLLACDPAEAPRADEPESPGPIPGFTSDDLREGERLTRESGCFVCHGSELDGTQLAPSLHGLDVSADEAGVRRIAGAIVEGAEEPGEYPTRMPPRGGAPLDDDEVRLVAAYLVHLGATAE